MAATRPVREREAVAAESVRLDSLSAANTEDVIARSVIDRVTPPLTPTRPNRRGALSDEAGHRW